MIYSVKHMAGNEHFPRGWYVRGSNGRVARFYGAFATRELARAEAKRRQDGGS